MSAYVKRAVLYFSDISKIYHYQSERLPSARCRQSSLARPFGLCQAGNRRPAPERLLKMREYTSLICVNFLNNFWQLSKAEYRMFKSSFKLMLPIWLLNISKFFLDSDSEEDKKKRRKKADKRSRSTSRRKERRSRSPRRRR